jgi:plasmid maintenance system antidote protein VapI
MNAGVLRPIQRCGWLGTSTQALGFWLNLQRAYDLEITRDKFSHVIEKEVQPASLVVASVD